MTTTQTDRLLGVTVSLALKAPVKAATTANVTLSGEQAIDGIALVDGDRVLVKNQTNAVENGIYDVGVTNWSRSKDFDGARDVVTGTRVYIASGTLYAGYEATVTTTGDITIGTSNINFSLLLVVDAGLSADLETIADSIADINTCSTNIAAIIAAPAEAAAAASSAVDAATAQGLAEDARDLAQGYALAADVDKIEWQGAWSAGTYQINDAVTHNDSSWIATAITTEEPSIAATDWDVLALKGTDGAGSGDVNGPASATDGAVALFDGITGKLIKNGVVLGTAATLNVGTGANNIVQLDGTAKLPAVDGSALTGVSSSLSNDFRLTLTTGVPVTTSDVASSSTIYLTPYTGNKISLYSGTVWETVSSSEVSLAISGLTSGKPYDIFCYNNAGTPTLEFLVWTNDTTRATSLVRQDGILVKSGATTRRYVGSFYTTGTTTTADTLTSRYLWNYYNRALRPVKRFETTDSWVYTTATWREANASTNNRINFISGVAEDSILLNLIGVYSNSAVQYAMVALGYDSTSVPSSIYGSGASQQASLSNYVTSSYSGIMTVGKHFVSWLEISAAAGTTTWYGDINPASGVPDKIQSGIMGIIRG